MITTTANILVWLPFVLNMACQPIGGTTSCSPAAPSIHAFRVDYGNYAASRAQVGPLEAQMQSAGVNVVALGAGRAEWAFFKWSGHEATWSNDVKDTGIDFLADDAARFRQWARVDAVVDVLAPNYIKAHPQAAAISFTGQPSPDWVSTTELVSGEYGRQLLAMIEYIAANYPVDSISLTELCYHSQGYGPDDKAAYLAYTDRADWPRTASGVIDRDDPSIGNWRSQLVARFISQAAAAAHKYGKQFNLDVQVNPAKLANAAKEHGTDYNLLRQYVDRLIVWAYYDIDSYSPETLTPIARYFQAFGRDRVIVSLGLWSNQYPQTPPDALQRAMLAAQAGGISDLWITPSLLMTPQHWQVLTDVWGARPLP